MADGSFRLHEQHKYIGKIVSERKHSKPLRDVEKRISNINKKIKELQHKKEFAYKSSVKVKKKIHNQINQIIKCFRAREHQLLGEVDDAYIAEDSRINKELTELQSALAHCQILYNHLEDFKGNVDILSKINNACAEISLGEKFELKPLELLSDFEQMKEVANSYGQLDAEFIHKSTTLVNSSKCSFQADVPENSVLIVDVESKTQKNNFHALSGRNRSDSQDSFEIIDLLENMSCQDIERNTVMIEKQNIEFCKASSENGVKSSETAKRSENSEVSLGSSNSCEVNSALMSQMKKFQNCTSNSQKLNEFEKNTHCLSKLNVEQMYAREIIENKHTSDYSILKDADNWLDRSATAKKSLKVKKDEVVYAEKNTILSPAYTIQQSFKQFLTKGNTAKWLSLN